MTTACSLCARHRRVSPVLVIVTGYDTFSHCKMPRQSLAYKATYGTQFLGQSYVISYTGNE